MRVHSGPRASSGWTSTRSRADGWRTRPARILGKSGGGHDLLSKGAGGHVTLTGRGPRQHAARRGMRPGVGSRPMGANADVIRRLTDESFIAGNFETWDEIVAGDLVDNDPMPGLPAAGEGLKTLAQMVVSTFD